MCLQGCLFVIRGPLVLLKTRHEFRAGSSRGPCPHRMANIAPTSWVRCRVLECVRDYVVINSVVVCVEGSVWALTC